MKRQGKKEPKEVKSVTAVKEKMAYEKGKKK